MLKHIQVIDNACVPSTSVELRPVFHELKFNSKYIAVLYNNKYSTEEIYSDEKFIQELQLWNWKGELKKRICFDFLLTSMLYRKMIFFMLLIPADPTIFILMTLNET